MSSDESSSSETELVSKKTGKKAKHNGKKKEKAAQPPVVVTPHGKNEGTNTDWAYKAPQGAVLADHSADAEEFDWEALKANENLELWIIRVPEGVKAKHLQDLKLDAPSTSKTARIGSLDKKHASYDIWSVGEDQNETVGAEEMKGLSCLLPRKKKAGKLYLAPELMTRHIAISARPPVPTPESLQTSGSDMSWATHQNPARPSYPKEMLKHRFMPLGSLAPANGTEEDDMDIDHPPEYPPDTDVNSPKKAKEGDLKAKKRKVDDNGAKKAKKARKAQ